MPKPRILAVTLLLVFSVVLAACGTEDADPTPAPTATRSPVLPTEMPGTTEMAEASPAATGRATPATATVVTPAIAVATPAVVVQPTETETATATSAVMVAATPVSTVTTPAQASPVASPVATPVSTPVRAMLVLNGTEQVDYVITPDGCVGLGEWRSLKPGTQVIVRDANGTVVDIGTLQAGDGGCTWTADITAPGSEFLSISIPMVTEMWFTQSDIEAGEVEITLP